jgi:hypothetical protein
MLAWVNGVGGLVAATLWFAAKVQSIPAEFSMAHKNEVAIGYFGDWITSCVLALVLWLVLLVLVDIGRRVRRIGTGR